MDTSGGPALTPAISPAITPDALARTAVKFTANPEREGAAAPVAWGP